ncbi:MAG: OmpW family outer membrane protein [Moraxellaceae bacterium]|nr:OmpW family outer membrane protein [Moraxellaceae bacterium]
MQRHMTTVLFATLMGMAGYSAAAEEMGSTSFGIHGAYSTGGDIEESDTGLGIQMKFPMSNTVAIEVALTRFSDNFADSGIALDQELTSLGVSALFQSPIATSTNAYFLAGLNYNMVDVDVTVDPGVFPPGVTSSMDVDDAMGVHIGVGLDHQLNKNIGIFAEYRYTVLDLEGEITATNGIVSMSQTVEGDYDFGLLKAGINFSF